MHNVLQCTFPGVCFRIVGVAYVNYHRCAWVLVCGLPIPQAPNKKEKTGHP